MDNNFFFFNCKAFPNCRSLSRKSRQTKPSQAKIYFVIFIYLKSNTHPSCYTLLFIVISRFLWHESLQKSVFYHVITTCQLSCNKNSNMLQNKTNSDSSMVNHTIHCIWILINSYKTIGTFPIWYSWNG